MPEPLIAGCDQSVTYVRTDATGARIQPTIDTVTATLDGEAVELAHTPTWDADAEEHVLQLDGSELTAGTLVITYVGTDPESDGNAPAFADSETYTVTAYDPSGLLCLVEDVKRKLTVGDTEDDADLLAYVITASARFRMWAGLPFTCPQVVETRCFHADGPTVYADELVSVSEDADVPVADQDGNALVFAARHGHRPGDFVPWVSLSCAYTGEVAVTGTWGYSEIPADVKGAVASTAATLYLRDKHGAEGNYIGNLSGLSKDAQETAERYRPMRM